MRPVIRPVLVSLAAVGMALTGAASAQACEKHEAPKPESSVSDGGHQAPDSQGPRGTGERGGHEAPEPQKHGQHGQHSENGRHGGNGEHGENGGNGGNGGNGQNGGQAPQQSTPQLTVNNVETGFKNSDNNSIVNHFYFGDGHA